MTSPTPPPAHHAGLQAVRLVARGWWLLVLRGVFSLVFGAVAFLFPELGLVVILSFLAAWMILDGVGALLHAARHEQRPDGRGRLWLAVDGLIALGAACVLLFMPGLSALGLVIVTGAWFLVAGVARLMLAFRLASVLLGLLGALGILAGAWLMLRPGPGILAVIWLIAIEAMVVGVLQIGLGWRLRRIHADPHHQPGQMRI